jgi:hypothetical protein
MPMRRGVGDIVPLTVPPGTDTDVSVPVANGEPVDPSALVTTPGSGIPLTPEQYFGGTGVDPSQYQGSPPGATVPGENSPFAWPPFNIPGMALLRQASGAISYREIIPPNSILPPALDRTNPLLRIVRPEPNKWDRKILREAQAWNWIAAHGGLKSCCRIPELGAPIWEQPPWEVMPSQGQEYRQMYRLLASATSGGPPFDGTDTIVGQFRVPIGYDGVLTTIVTGFTGSGFVDGSGSIVWRVKIGARYAKTLGNVLFSYGSFQTALLVPGISIRMISGQTLQLIASVPNGSPISTDASSYITMAAFGWTYPHR